MKHLRETFTDREFANLKAIKEDTGLNWHDFLMLFVDEYYILEQLDFWKDLVRQHEEVKT